MKKAKFCISLCISQEMELTVSDDVSDDELEDLAVEAVEYPIGVVDYNPRGDEWIVDDLSVTRL